MGVIDPDQPCRSTAAKNVRVAINPRRAFNNEVVRTAAFVLSIALIAWIAFSVWYEP
jgi:hypothetical protein